jgi:glycosyltransferase involved in cell wall biosynthesis
MRVSVVIPACNEQGSLPLVLRAIPATLVQSVIVADNGSTDETPVVAAANGAKVVSEPRRGYGFACFAGVQHAITHDNPDVIVMLDAANKEDAGEMPLLLHALRSGEADFVLGSRVRRAQRGALQPAQRFGNWMTTRVMQALYGVTVTDLAPFRAIRASLLTRLDMRERTYGWPTEMIVKAAICRARITEVDVSYQPRLSGKSKVSGTVRGSVKAGVVILRTTLTYRNWRPPHA